MSANDIRRRVRRGIGGYLVSQPIALLIQLAGVPLYLHFWGVDLYGEWLILAAIPAYLSLSDVGFTSATLHAMTMQVAAGDRPAALRYFRTSWWLITAISIVVCGAVTVGVYTLPVAAWFNLGLLGGDDVALLLTLFALHVVVSLQTGLLNAGFYSEGEYGQGTLFLSLGRLIEFLLVVAAVVAGHGPVGAAAALLVGRVVILVAMGWRLRRVAPWLSLGLFGFSRAAARELFGPAAGFTGYIVGGALNVQGPVLIIGAVFGPAAVVPFATLRTLTRLVPQMLQSISNIVRPEIGIAVGHGDMATTRRLNRYACRLALWVVLAAAIGLSLFGDWIVALWTSGRVTAEQPLFALLLAIMAANAVWTANAWTLQAVNRVRMQALVYILANGTALVAMGLAGASAGLAGPAIALLAAEIVMAGFVVRWTFAFLGESPALFLLSLLVPPFDIVRQLRGR